MNDLDELTAAAEAAASEYDDAFAAGAPEGVLSDLRKAVDQTERARATAQFQQEQRDAFGDHLEFAEDGVTVTNIGVEPTVRDSEVS